MIREWKELGIPEGYGPYRLLYNPASGTVIAELRSIGAGIRRKERFMDDVAFDQIAKRLATTDTRRAVVRTAVVLGATSVIAQAIQRLLAADSRR